MDIDNHRRVLQVPIWRKSQNQRLGKAQVLNTPGFLKHKARAKIFGGQEVFDRFLILEWIFFIVIDIVTNMFGKSVLQIYSNSSFLLIFLLHPSPAVPNGLWPLPGSSPDSRHQEPPPPGPAGAGYDHPRIQHDPTGSGINSLITFLLKIARNSWCDWCDTISYMVILHDVHVDHR